MLTTRTYITRSGGDQKMISLTIAISNELLLQVKDTSNGLQFGKIALVVTDGRECIALRNDEVRAAAQALAYLADLLDIEGEGE